MNKQILKRASALVAATVIASGMVAVSYNPAAASTRASTQIAAVAAQTEDQKGVLIARAEANGPAAKAGLRRGDIVLSVNGKAVNDVQALRDALNVLKPGAAVEVVVDRGGNEQTLTVTLGDRDGNAYLGISPAVETAASTESPSIAPSGNEAGNNSAAENPVTPAPDVSPASPTSPTSPNEPMKPMTRTRPSEAMPFGRAFGQVSVTGVVTGSPAEKAGLKIGDVISAVDGQSLSPRVNLADLIAAKKPGDSVTMTVTSGIVTSTAQSEATMTSARTVTVTLGTNPQKAGVAWLGIQYRPAFMVLSQDMLPGNMPSPHGRSNRVPDQTPDQTPGQAPNQVPNQTPGQDQAPDQAAPVQEGAWVADVVDGSPAAQAGLAERDVIVELNGTAVSTAEDVVKAVQGLEVGDVVTLTVMRGNERQEIEATLGDNPTAAGKPYLGVELGTLSIQMQPSQPGSQPGGMTLPFQLDENGMPNLDELLNQLREQMPDPVPSMPSAPDRTPDRTPDGAPSQGNL